jgi:hypothetical protein
MSFYETYPRIGLIKRKKRKEFVFDKKNVLLTLHQIKTNSQFSFIAVTDDQLKQN